MNAKWLSAAILAGSILGPGQALAGSELLPGARQSCTTENCLATQLGVILKSAPNKTGKWVGEVFVAANECLRVAVVSTSNLSTGAAADLVMAVVGPTGGRLNGDGTLDIYSNDDSDTLNPVVKIDPAPVSGWYTVSIGPFSSTPVDVQLSLRYARYNSGNPNCAVPTPKLLAAPGTRSRKK